MQKQTKLGIIGGSGIYKMKGIDVVKEHQVKTPFGDPSDAIIEAKIEDRSVYFISRHGKGHRFSPTEVNYRANIYALKTFDVTHVLALSAVGIMRQEIKPGDFVIPDQIFDRTKGVRASTFFGEGIVGHVGFADPFCNGFRKLINEVAVTIEDVNVHFGGTYVCMEGPQFSTRAESNFYRTTLNPVVIGMTALPEAKLAREAEMCYGLLALATDYDCWHETEEDVTVEMVLDVLRKNAEKANALAKGVAAKLPPSIECGCFTAAQNSIMTAPDFIPKETKERLSLLYGKYFA